MERPSPPLTSCKHVQLWVSAAASAKRLIGVRAMSRTKVACLITNSAFVCQPQTSF